MSTGDVLPFERADHSVPSTERVVLHVRLWPAKGVAKEELIVLVHQYSKMGGRGELMEGIAAQLTNREYNVVTFDQRGVGKSTGSATISGVSEIDDVISVCDFCAKRLRANHVVLVASSGGAPIAGSALDRIGFVKAGVFIGYPMGWAAWVLFHAHFENIKTSKKPKLFILGTNDGFTSVSQFESMYDVMPDPKFKIYVDGVGHFELEGPDYDVFMAEKTDEFIRNL
eukprot:comp97521_c0_seq1/m.48669 comp97521_c0_seq1/g.48669  ORF comp97521_c0_seq1/g.48669 comp97521_c0_seq1/m.48669 type:complete len:227 (-) comp97521_c0_seq1:766-1446(-)